MFENGENQNSPPELSEQDILEAMKNLQGYVDITPSDFKQIYEIACSMVMDRLLNTVKAVDLMTKTVVIVEQTMSLVKAAPILAENRVSGAPVVDEVKKIVGIVSEKDFLEAMGFASNPSFMQIATHCLHNKNCMIGNLHGRTVTDIMTKPPIVGTSEMTVGDISAIFTTQKINRLPIVDSNEEIVGIVTRTDLANAYHVFSGGR